MTRWVVMLRMCGRHVFFLVVLVLATSARVTAGEAFSPFADVSEFDGKVVGKAAIDLIQLSANPGVGGALFNVAQPGRDTQLIISNAGFGTDFPFEGTFIDGYWGGALNHASLKDSLSLINTIGEPVSVEIERDILTLQASFGLSIPIDNAFKYQPYISLSFARIDTESLSEGRIDESMPPAIDFQQSKTDSLTSSLTQELLYEQFFGAGRLQALAMYILSYTDTTDVKNPNLDTFGWGHSGIVKLRWSQPTGLKTAGRPWWWNTYIEHVNLINQDEISLGFKYYNEFGVGFDYDMLIKPLGLFGVRYIGFKIGGIYGDGVSGASVGLTFR